jgi:hypothetical protein
MVRIHQAREARAHDLLPPSSAVGVLPLGRAVLVKGFGYRPGRSYARALRAGVRNPSPEPTHSAGTKGQILSTSSASCIPR